MKNADKNIPPQTEGSQTDFTSSRAFNNIPQAHQAFLSAKAKLLDISNWHTYSGPGSSVFGLTNEKGVLLHRLAEINDHFYIDLPAAPGPDAGDGLEWVLVENIIEEGSENTVEESITMMVRPTTDPGKDTVATAHFFSDRSTNTLIISRYGNKVSAQAHGRNEMPNNNGVDMFDTVRNTVIALSARVGLSGIQWQNLVNGLLK